MGKERERSSEERMMGGNRKERKSDEWLMGRKGK